MTQAITSIDTTCCIVGGGPAGLMLGLLLARAGVDVVVLEKHADFLRDFRGDTIHPSTMEVMHDLGLLQDFLKLPHQPVRNLTVQFGETAIRFADFSHLPVKAPFIAMMPQWDFLNFIAARAGQAQHFRLRMESEAIGLLRENERVVGVKSRESGGEVEIRARLVIAADGRSSVMRAAAGLVPKEFGAPIDVLWFRLSRRPGDTDQMQGRFDRGHIFIMLNRGDYWQCASVIPKDGHAPIRAAGIAAFRSSLSALLPFDVARLDELRDWDQIKLLSVQINRLERWSAPGLLCIGDAAHAMSPVGGVGVNLAIQDAVATANLLAVKLRDGRFTDSDLHAVERRRALPTRVTQRLQIVMQNTIIASTLGATAQLKPPLALRIITAIPGLRRLPARLIGLGVRPERVAVATG
jgi:2-polyprenyl-6-methoxyphenol hydroxylase-like FAD-dependent oxidoreductase